MLRAGCHLTYCRSWPASQSRTCCALSSTPSPPLPSRSAAAPHPSLSSPFTCSSLDVTLLSCARRAFNPHVCICPPTDCSWSAGWLQVVKEPEDLEALAKELTVRHTRVGRQRMQRLDTVYRYWVLPATCPCALPCRPAHVDIERDSARQRSFNMEWRQLDGQRVCLLHAEE